MQQSSEVQIDQQSLQNVSLAIQQEGGIKNVWKIKGKKKEQRKRIGKIIGKKKKSEEWCKRKKKKKKKRKILLIQQSLQNVSLAIEQQGNIKNVWN